MLLGAGSFIQSCSDDFIDVAPSESMTIGDLEKFNNDNGATYFVNSIYAKFLDWNMSTFAWIGVTSIVSDDADKGSSPGDNGSDKNILDALTFTATTPFIQRIICIELSGN